ETLNQLSRERGTLFVRESKRFRQELLGIHISTLSRILPAEVALDFDARDNESRDDERFEAGRSRGPRGASDEHHDEHDWSQPDVRSRARDEHARELGRGPGSDNRNDDSHDGLRDRDDPRWTERDHDSRGLDPRDVFM